MKKIFTLMAVALLGLGVMQAEKVTIKTTTWSASKPKNVASQEGELTVKDGVYCFENFLESGSGLYFTVDLPAVGETSAINFSDEHGYLYEEDGYSIYYAGTDDYEKGDDSGENEVESLTLYSVTGNAEDDITVWWPMYYAGKTYASVSCNEEGLYELLICMTGYFDEDAENYAPYYGVWVDFTITPSDEPQTPVEPGYEESEQPVTVMIGNWSDGSWQAEYEDYNTTLKLNADGSLTLKDFCEDSGVPLNFYLDKALTYEEGTEDYEGYYWSNVYFNNTEKYNDWTYYVLYPDGSWPSNGECILYSVSGNPEDDVTVYWPAVGAGNQVASGYAYVEQTGTTEYFLYSIIDGYTSSEANQWVSNLNGFLKIGFYFNMEEWPVYTPEAGVSAIESANGEVEYYNLQGVRVANPENGIFVRRQGNKVSKVVIR